MRLRTFLRTQLYALIVGVVATVGSLYLIFTFVRDGMSGLNVPGAGGFQETFRGVPNPGGSSAFFLILLPVVATFCWWGIISDWKSVKETAEKEPSDESQKQNKKSDMATPRKPSD